MLKTIVLGSLREELQKFFHAHAYRGVRRDPNSMSPLRLVLCGAACVVLACCRQIDHTLQVVQTMVDLYANETAVMGLQPVNEPWQFTPMDWLKVGTTVPALCVCRGQDLLRFEAGRALPFFCFLFCPCFGHVCG